MVLFAAVTVEARSEYYPQRYAFYVESNLYSTDIAATLNGSHEGGVGIELSDCQIGPAPKITLVPGGAGIIRRIGGRLCNGQIGLLPYAGAGALYSLVNFKEGAITTSYVVPALVKSKDLTFSGIRTTKEDTTNLVIFNLSEGSAAIKLDIHDEKAVVIATEYITIEPGKFIFHKISASVEIGTVKVTGGSQFGYPGQNTSPDVVGFAIVSTALGGSVQILTQ